MLDEDAPAREGIADSWRWKQDAASWVGSPTIVHGDVATMNRHVATCLAEYLDDFASLARARTAMVLGDDGPSHAVRWRGDTLAQFRARILDTITSHPQRVCAVELELDLRVWVRTSETRLVPELVWLRYPGTELAMHTLCDEAGAWVDFALCNTLFSAFTFPDCDPNPLHSLNQPLLEAALRRYSARFAEPLEVYGELPGRTSLGFSSDRDDY